MLKNMGRIQTCCFELPLPLSVVLPCNRRRATHLKMDDKVNMSETYWAPVKSRHENVGSFAQCKQALTMCCGVSGSNPWITHQLARGYCAALPVKAGAEGVSVECVRQRGDVQRRRGDLWVDHNYNTALLLE